MGYGTLLNQSTLYIFAKQLGHVETRSPMSHGEGSGHSRYALYGLIQNSD